MRRSLLALVVLPLLAASPPARAEGPPDVDSYVERLLARWHVPGASVAVVQDGRVALLKGYGLASVELGVPAAADTVYQLASVTKPFTAAAVMLLAQDGKLGLDDKVAALVPGLPDAWGAVTVRHLLSHTSGIKDLTGRKDFGATIRQDFTPRELVGTVAGEPLEFTPGERHAYSNTGYILLGMVIERASGRKYGEFLAERIFRPLGMAATRANDLHAVIPGRAAGHTWAGKELRLGEYHSATQPFAAGMLASTAADLVKWDAGLATLLPPAARESMWAPTRLADGREAPYGLGWQVGRVRGHRQVSHGGGIPGFATEFSHFPDDGLTVIVLLNSDAGHAGLLARGIAGRFVPALAERTEPVDDPDPATTGRLRGLFDQIRRGEVDPARFTEEARKALVPRIVQGRDRFAALGDLKSFVLLDREGGEDGLRLAYRAEFETETLRAEVSLDRAGQIRGLGLRPEE